MTEENWPGPQRPPAEEPPAEGPHAPESAAQQQGHQGQEGPSLHESPASQRTPHGRPGDHPEGQVENQPSERPQPGPQQAPAAQPAPVQHPTTPSPQSGIASQPGSSPQQPSAARPPEATAPQAAPSPTAAPEVAPTSDEALRNRLSAVRSEVAKAVVGQDAAVTSVMIGLLVRGHVLLEGVPGVAKTLLVRAISSALQLDTGRVQFTPDLMPGDVTGSLVYDSTTGDFSFREGPVFTNLLLADEINRTPPKTQASLLEAMEERQVSVDGAGRQLPDPFLVTATQNPVEYEGTYPLPEAQLDRFLLKVTLQLPERGEEVEVIRRHAEGFNPSDLAAAGVTPVASADDVIAARRAVGTVQIAPEVLGYIVDIARATRSAPSFQLGVSPRGATALMNAAKAWAWLSGRGYVTPDDVKALALPTLRHRVALTPEASMDGAGADDVLGGILSSTPVPR